MYFLTKFTTEYAEDNNRANTFYYAPVIGQPLAVHVCDSTGASQLETHYRYIRAQGLVTATLDARGNETDIAYTPIPGSSPTAYYDSHATVTLPPAGSDPTKRKQKVYTYEYPAGPLEHVQALDENGVQVSKQSYSYDASGPLLSTTDQDNRSSSVSYDLRYNVTSLTDPASNVTNYSYDPETGWPTEMQYPLGDNNWIGDPSTHDNGYDPVGRVLETSENGNGDSITTTFQYDDPEGLLTQQITGNLAPVILQYTPNLGSLQQRNDDAGERRYDYDDFGNCFARNIVRFDRSGYNSTLREGAIDVSDIFQMYPP